MFYCKLSFIDKDVNSIVLFCSVFSVSTKMAVTSTTKSKNEQKHRDSPHNRRQRQHKLLKIDSFTGANLDFSSVLP